MEGIDEVNNTYPIVTNYYLFICWLLFTVE